MKDITKILLAAAIGLIVGAGGVMAFSNTSETRMAESEHEMPDGSMMHATSDMQGEMYGMMQSLNGKTGDAFDEAFLKEMVVHHQGAVAMAESALRNAKHQEIKDLAQAIITAQNTEIKEMQTWQENWYGKG